MNMRLLKNTRDIFGYDYFRCYWCGCDYDDNYTIEYEVQNKFRDKEYFLVCRKCYKEHKKYILEHIKELQTTYFDFIKGKYVKYEV